MLCDLIHIVKIVVFQIPFFAPDLHTTEYTDGNNFFINSCVFPQIRRK